MGYVVRMFDGLVTPEYIQRGDTQNMGTGAALTSFLPLPGGGFFDNYGSRTSPQGIRPISKTGVFYGTASELRSQLLAWRAKLGRRGKLTVEFDDGQFLWQWARLQDLDTPRPSNAKQRWLPYTLTWITAAQNWRSFSHRADFWEWGDSSWIFGDGTAAFGVGSVSFDLNDPLTEEITIDHAGNIDAPNVRLRFDLSGEWQNAYLVNHTTGQTILLTRSAANQRRWLEIDAGARSILLGPIDPYAIQSITRYFNTLTVTTDGTHAVLVDDSVRLSGTGLYDGDYYPVTSVTATQFTVTVSPRSSAYGLATGGLGEVLTNAYSLATFSDKERWFVLAPGENQIEVLWTPVRPSGILLEVEYDDHYA